MGDVLHLLSALTAHKLGELGLIRSGQRLQKGLQCISGKAFTRCSER